jgi:hypothetical protein
MQELFCRIRDMGRTYLDKKMSTKNMEDAQLSYIHGYEIRGLNISLGNEKIESNEHRRRMNLVVLVDTMKSI